MCGNNELLATGVLTTTRMLVHLASWTAALVGPHDKICGSISTCESISTVSTRLFETASRGSCRRIMASSFLRAVAQRAVDTTGCVVACAATTLQKILEIDVLRETILFHVPPASVAGVCRTFQSTLAEDDYWLYRLENAMTISSTTEPAVCARIPGNTHALRAWCNDWFCYWEGSFGLPRDREKNFVFHPSLQTSACGVLRPLDFELDRSLTSARDACRHLSRLRRIMRMAVAPGELDIGWGDESDNSWMPILVPWRAHDGALTPERLLERLGAHPQLRKSVIVRDDLNNNDDDDDDDDTSDRRGRTYSLLAGAAAHLPSFRTELRFFLGTHRFSAGTTGIENSLVFLAGSGLLNPIPCFAVARVAPGLVAGVMGGVVHT